jgi:hypothetical protein
LCCDVSPDGLTVAGGTQLQGEDAHIVYWSALILFLLLDFFIDFIFGQGSKTARCTSADT